MGFDLGDTINNWAGTAALGPMGYPLDYNYQRDQQQNAQDLGYAKNRTSASATNLGSIQGQQIGASNDFKQNAGMYKGLLQDQAVKPLRMQMSQKLADTKLNASSRGLLGSGIQQRNSANVASQYKSAYSNGMNQAEGNFQNLNNQITGAPISTGLEIGGYQQNAQDQYYRYALQNMQAQNSIAGGIGQGAGYGIGSYIGSQQKMGGF